MLNSSQTICILCSYVKTFSNLCAPFSATKYSLLPFFTILIFCLLFNAKNYILGEAIDVEYASFFSAAILFMASPCNLSA